MEGVAFFLALIIARFFDITLFPFTQNPFQDIMIGTVGALPPFVFFLFILSEKSREIPFLNSLRKTVLTELKAVFSSSCLIDLVIISLIAGVAEEFLFRGVLQVKFGIFAASIVFGLVHLVSPAYVIVATIIGFYIGAFFLVSGSLLIPVQIHFSYDLGALIYLKYFVKEGN